MHMKILPRSKASANRKKPKTLKSTKTHDTNYSPPEFITLYEEYYGLVMYFFRQRKYSLEDARDLTHDTFTNVLKGLSHFRGQTKVRNWIMKIALNVLIDDIKKYGPMSIRHKQNIEIDVLNKLSEDAGTTDTFVSNMVHEERKVLLARAMNSLPPRMRCCISLRIIMELKYHEIAIIMKSNPNTVKSLLFQARKKLKSLMNKGGRE